MGGYGSTRWGWRATRATTDGLPALDVRALARAGALRSGTRTEWGWTHGGVPIGAVTLEARADAVFLDYRIQDAVDADSCSVREPVTLDATPCHYGGVRHWFRCPGCRTRRVLLFCVGGIFRCRLCHDLAYASTRADRATRLARQRSFSAA